MKTTINRTIAVAVISAATSFAACATLAAESIKPGVNIHRVVAKEVASVNTPRGGFVWEAPQAGSDLVVHNIAKGAARQNSAGFRWTASASDVELASVSGSTYPNSPVSETQGFIWGIRNVSEQNGFIWGIRSQADQSGFIWGIRNQADQSGFIWGIRNQADQSGFIWGIRNQADQSGFIWGIRNQANQSGFIWGIRNRADQSGFIWGIR